MPGLKTTQYGTGDYTWMRNLDGLDEALTGQIDISDFTAGTHFPNGFLPSGLPLRVDDLDDIRPWADVAGAKLGFLKGDYKTDGVEDVNVAFIPRGNIKIAKLPIAFAIPATAAQPQFFFGS